MKQPFEERPGLPSLAPHGDEGRSYPRLRICIATPDIVGPIRCGGIGTAYANLALALAEAGHEVTILYLLSDLWEQGNAGNSQDLYRGKGIRFVALPGSDTFYLDSLVCAISYMACRWLRKRDGDFDVIHFPDWMGLGYYSLLSKRQGLAFQNCALVVGTHAPTLWHLAGNMDFVSTLDILERDFMERKSVAYADAVVSPSRYMLQWLVDQEWDLPERVYVQPNIITDDLTAEYDPENIGVKELVFFGRLEKRKGLDLFFRAVDILAEANDISHGISITFLGKQEIVEGRKSGDYIAERAGQWPFPARVISDLNRDGALAYLREGGRLAVMPSLVDNFPYTVLECCGAGIPFLASATGGIPEVIAPEDRERTCFETRPGALSEMLAQAIRKGVRRARPAVDFESVRKAWINWHQVLHASLAAPLSTEGDDAGPLTDPPLVSVCMTTFNRPHLLAQALESLRAQDYTKFEVVLVDDGSREPPALAYLDELEAEFSSKGWTIIRQENKYPGAARNNAARHSAGEYLLFMDDDNYAEPHEISTFIGVAQRTGADILTCPAKRFAGYRAPSGPPDHIWLPLGAAADVGVLKNCYGDANALVRREAFEALGGFMEDYGLGHEDHEFFARAVLKGLRLEVVPEELFWYRVQKNNVTVGTRYEANMVRLLRPYLEAMPIELRGVVRLLQGLYHARANETIADQVYAHYKTLPRAEFLKAVLMAPWRIARKFFRDKL